MKERHWRSALFASSLLCLLSLSVAAHAQTPAAPAPPKIDSGDTAWLLASTALVLLMTPGLALFYGGMVSTKIVLNMIMMSFVSIAVVTVVWLVAGFSLAFGHGAGGAGLAGGSTPGCARSGPSPSPATCRPCCTPRSSSASP